MNQYLSCEDRVFLLWEAVVLSNLAEGVGGKTENALASNMAQNISKFLHKKSVHTSSEIRCPCRLFYNFNNWLNRVKGITLVLKAANS
jgi:hypothetical protein